MNAVQDYVARQSEECKTRWFKEHKAVSMLAGYSIDVVTIINWQKPDSWNYGCRYILHRRWLMVVGDIGEAIFEWGQDITPDFLLSLNFDYFMGKCQASPTGREFTQWDPRTAFMSMGQTCGEEGMESIKVACKELTTGSCREDYAEAASEYYNRSGDAEGASMIREFGVVPSVHAIGMFVGLQMALKQLKEAKP